MPSEIKRRVKDLKGGHMGVQVGWYNWKEKVESIGKNVRRKVVAMKHGKNRKVRKYKKTMKIC